MAVPALAFRITQLEAMQMNRFCRGSETPLVWSLDVRFVFPLRHGLDDVASLLYCEQHTRLNGGDCSLTRLEQQRLCATVPRFLLCLLEAGSFLLPEPLQSSVLRKQLVCQYQFRSEQSVSGRLAQALDGMGSRLESSTVVNKWQMCWRRLQATQRHLEK